MNRRSIMTATMRVERRQRGALEAAANFLLLPLLLLLLLLLPFGSAISVVEEEAERYPPPLSGKLLYGGCPAAGRTDGRPTTWLLAGLERAARRPPNKYLVATNELFLAR